MLYIKAQPWPLIFALLIPIGGFRSHGQSCGAAYGLMARETINWLFRVLFELLESGDQAYFMIIRHAHGFDPMDSPGLFQEYNWS